jgi:hypothetical protein
MIDENLKAELLAEAARKPVRQYTQLDGFLDQEPDCLMKPDEDGDCLFAGRTHELRNTDLPVRVQVLRGTKPEDVARLLRKFAKWIDRDPELLESLWEKPC